MKRIPLVLSTLAALAVLTSTAAAERRKKMKEADPVHDFHSVDRLTQVSTFGIALGIEVWDEDSAIDQVMGFDLSGHYVSPSGAGGYLVVPMSYLSSDDINIGPVVIEGDSEAVIGNLEVGGLYTRPIGEHADFVGHLGVALPTADDDNDIGLLQPYAAVPRLGDYVQRAPNTTWLRLGFSPMGRVGPVFWRADVGVDIMLDDQDGEGFDSSPIFRINGAVGVDLGPADITAELATNIYSLEDDNADETATTLAIGGRFEAGSVQPGLAVILPVGLDDPTLDNLELAFALSLTARMP